MTTSTAIKSVKLKELVAGLEDGQYAAPKLQRGFVWNGHKAARLMDSVYQGMPIGTVTIWETGKKNETSLKVTTGLLPPYQKRHSRIRFILDGQQRLTVPYSVLTGAK